MQESCQVVDRVMSSYSIRCFSILHSVIARGSDWWFLSGTQKITRRTLGKANAYIQRIDPKHIVLWACFTDHLHKHRSGIFSPTPCKGFESRQKCVSLHWFLCCHWPPRHHCSSGKPQELQISKEMPRRIQGRCSCVAIQRIIHLRNFSNSKQFRCVMTPGWTYFIKSGQRGCMTINTLDCTRCEQWKHLKEKFWQPTAKTSLAGKSLGNQIQRLASSKLLLASTVLRAGMFWLKAKPAQHKICLINTKTPYSRR